MDTEKMKKVQKLTQDEKITFVYVLKKMRDCKRKKDRELMFNAYLEFLKSLDSSDNDDTEGNSSDNDDAEGNSSDNDDTEGKLRRHANFVIHDQTCTDCFCAVDQETGLCCNCGKKC